MYTAMLQNKTFKALVAPILDASTVCGNLHPHKNSIALERIQYLGSAAADFVFALITGQNHLRNVVESYPSSISVIDNYLSQYSSWSHFSTVQWIYSDYFIFSPRSHSLSLLCKHYSFFVNSIFWWNSVSFDILSIPRSIPCHSTFRQMLHN